MPPLGICDLDLFRCLLVRHATACGERDTHITGRRGATALVVHGVGGDYSVVRD